MHLTRTAFTLIELLVVIAIIGILSGLIIVTMSGATQSANIAKSQIFSNSLRNALMANLVSEWRFDEGSGQVVSDSWSGGNSGTLGGTTGSETNDPTWKTSGCVSGNCLSFDGVNDYVQVNDASNLNLSNYITLAVWIYINVLPSVAPNDWAQVVGKPSYAGSYCILLGNTGNMKFYLGGITSMLFARTFSVGAWYHIVGTYDGSAMRTYVNGSLTNSVAASGPITTYANPLYMGANASYALNGYIDDVRIFNVAVPVSQIKEQYYAGLNSLFAGGAISEQEYASRMLDLNYGYAKR